jgi:hypothetical protein
LKDMQKHITSLIAAVALIAAAGCFHANTVYLTPNDISAHGTVTFHADRAAVFDATRDVLHTMGFPDGVQRPEQGLLVTGRRQLGADTSAQAVGGGGAVGQAAVIEDSYEIKVSEGAGGTTVVATPHLFRGGVDITNAQVWTPGVQEQEWNQLFNSIQQALPASP